MGLVVRVAVDVSARPISCGRAGPAPWSVQASACGAAGREAGREKDAPGAGDEEGDGAGGAVVAAVAAPQGGKR